MNEKSITAGLEFAPAELQAMHRYCMEYRELVRSGGRPSAIQSLHFMAYQVCCYAAGVAYGPR